LRGGFALLFLAAIQTNRGKCGFLSYFVFICPDIPYKALSAPRRGRNKDIVLRLGQRGIALGMEFVLMINARPDGISLPQRRRSLKIVSRYRAQLAFR
jgi:hypothetical protein